MSYFVVFSFGIIIGSFLNVVALRRIKNKGFIFGRSKCPQCNKRLAWYDNLPLLSFIFLKGHCRHCNQQISLQYPFIELFCAIMTTALYDHQPNIPLFVCLLVLGYLLIIVSLIDWISKNIYFDHLALLLAAMMVFLTLTNKLSMSTLFGAAIFGGFFLFLRIIGSYIYKREAVGMGDIQLGVILGMPLVWQDIVLALYITFISASFVGLYLLYQKQEKDRELPLIPFISLGFLVALLYGPKIRAVLSLWYFS
tara:strand:+ start:1518 stop:2276 length:759 start_codon:yes stop_codon:yes gene_type:complete